MSTLSIPDALADHYQAQRPTAPLVDTIVRQLKRFLSIPLSERILLIRAPDRQAIEAALGGSTSITSAEDLLAAIRTRTVVTAGGIEVPFTNAQMDALRHKAEKQSITVEAVLGELCTLMLDSV